MPIPSCCGHHHHRHFNTSYDGLQQYFIFRDRIDPIWIFDGDIVQREPMPVGPSGRVRRREYPPHDPLMTPHGI